MTLHPIPFYNDERLEAKRRRKKWVDWVKLKRARWEPTMHSCICSFHFTPESFERKIFTPGTSRSRRLVADELGVAVFRLFMQQKIVTPEMMFQTEHVDR